MAEDKPSLKRILDLIRLRPAIYLAVPDISCIRSFLVGWKMHRSVCADGDHWADLFFAEFDAFVAAKFQSNLTAGWSHFLDQTDETHYSAGAASKQSVLRAGSCINYDDLNRLVQVDEGIPPLAGGTPLPVEDYAYDEEGNRTASHLSAIYASNDHTQLLEDEAFACV